jgi:hypothetical protein
MKEKLIPNLPEVTAGVIVDSISLDTKDNDYHGTQILVLLQKLL